MTTLRRPRMILVTAVAISYFLIFYAAGRSSWFKTDPMNPSWELFMPDYKNLWDGREGQFYEDAHKLSSADDFIPHFVAVTQMPGMTVGEAKHGCTWSEHESVNFHYAFDTEWVVREHSDDEIGRRRRQWHHYLAKKVIPYEKVRDKFEHQGIVILADDRDSIQRILVILRALIRLGSRIPVEIMYLPGELDQGSMREMRAVYPNVCFNDLSLGRNVLRVPRDPYSTNSTNFILKTTAVINSRFAEVLLLDSATVPVIDPAQLFASSTYKEYGTVFWPDLARTRPQNPAWAITNTACRMDEYEQDSGQLLVNKSRFWYHLQLAVWFKTSQRSYYQEFLQGDKDMFRFAWHALQTAYGKPRKWVATIGTVNDGFYCGHSLAQHHPDGERVAFIHNGLLKGMPMDVMRWNREKKGGVFRSYKRAPSDEEPLTNVEVGLKPDSWDYAPPRPDRAPTRPANMCVDMFEVQARDLDEIVPHYENMYEALGGYWELDNSQAKDACKARKSPGLCFDAL